jgi:hypothetical protein
MPFPGNGLQRIPASLSSRLRRGARGGERLRNWRLSHPQGRHPRHVSVGRFIATRRFFNRPEEFLPERWEKDFRQDPAPLCLLSLRGRPASVHRQHLCPGGSAHVARRHRLQKFQLKLVPGHRVATAPSLTLRPLKRNPGDFEEALRSVTAIGPEVINPANPAFPPAIPSECKSHCDIVGRYETRNKL